MRELAELLLTFGRIECATQHRSFRIADGGELSAQRAVDEGQRESWIRAQNFEEMVFDILLKTRIDPDRRIDFRHDKIRGTRQRRALEPGVNHVVDEISTHHAQIKAHGF